jgi:FkbM family methyltransferase
MAFRGRLEPEVLRLEEFVERGHVSVDVGANHGLWSYRLAQISRQVEAFEPQRWCADTLRSWNSPRVRVHQVALSDKTGPRDLSVPVLSGRPLTGYATLQPAPHDWRRVTIRAERLDDLEIKDLAFMKIDVEGHELAVLGGARETISREHPVLMVEVEQRHHPELPVLRVLDEIRALGYSGFFLIGNEWHGLDEFRFETHQGASEADPGSSAYVHNFLFLPDGGSFALRAGHIARVERARGPSPLALRAGQAA